MAEANFSFETKAFVDPPDKTAENVNGIVGYALADWLKSAISTQGYAAGEIWPEDHGWAFEFSKGARAYLCTCSITDEGEPREAHVSLVKVRSLKDRLLGRNHMQPDDSAVASIHDLLAADRSIEKLVRDHA